ncbi:hypothetical protein BYT27DRAFT_7011805, partial [Phlegmacium glaucopus]
IETEYSDSITYLAAKISTRLPRFQACEPQMFRTGDIVQAQLSFVIIPVKAGQRRMLTVLRSLALLD